MWQQPFTLDDLNRTNQNTLGATLGMEWVDSGEDYLTLRMPVDARTHQPMGLLHGGASAALAETMGSVASVLVQPPDAVRPIVGLELNCSHLRAVREGYVYGTVRAHRVGRTLHVWDIQIRDEAERLVCVARLTVLVQGK